MFLPKWIIALAVLALGVLATVLWYHGLPGTDRPGNVRDEPSHAEASFSGSGSCRPCHEKFYELWSTSHHGLAMQPVTARFVASELVPQIGEIRLGNQSFRAVLENGSAKVVQTGPGSEQSYPIDHALGGKNIYYFLTPTERGRLQVLPLAFDVRLKQWFDTTGSMVRHFSDIRDEALDWQESPLTFNTSCYSCHVSQLSTNYDLETDTYSTVWAEPGINCETCHGPAGEHVRVCREAAGEPAPEDLRIILQSQFTPAQANDTCAPCHAKMSPLSTDFQPGDRFFDHFDLHTLEHRDFYPDGRDLGENYTFTGWRMSPCVEAGQFDCVHCHTSSGRYRYAGDRSDLACLPCHEQHVENPAEHSHHDPASEGSRCVSCHMPRTEFARMVRHDHSMLPPVPAATVAYESPNACNLCHTDQDAAWSDSWVRNWYSRDYQKPLLYRAGLVDAARREDWSRLPEIIAYVNSPNRDEIFAASLLRLLVACDDPRKGPLLRGALEDPSPLVRSSAASGLAFVGGEDSRQALVQAARDDFLVVRQRVGAALAAYPREMFSDSEWQSAQTVMSEYETSLRVRPDDWVSHYNLGNFLFQRGQRQEALAAFDTASSLQPRAVQPLVNASLIHAGAGDTEQSERKLRRALELEPGSAAAHFNLGLLLGELGRLGEAEEHLRAALKLAPEMHEAAFNLCVVLADSRPGEAVEQCRKACALRPDDARYLYTLAFYLDRLGESEEAVLLLQRLLGQDPSYGSAYGLLGAIYEKQGRSGEAEKLYRRAAASRQLSSRDRLHFQALLK